MKKKTISILLALCLLLSMMPMSSVFALGGAIVTSGTTIPTDFKGNILEYEVVDESKQIAKINYYTQGVKGTSAYFAFQLNPETAVFSTSTGGDVNSALRGNQALVMPSLTSVDQLSAKGIADGYGDLLPLSYSGDSANSIPAFMKRETGYWLNEASERMYEISATNVPTGLKLGIAIIAEETAANQSLNGVVKWLENQFFSTTYGKPVYLHSVYIKPAPGKTLADITQDDIIFTGHSTDCPEGSAIISFGEIVNINVFMKDFNTGAASSTDLTTIGVTDITAPAAGGSVPRSTAVTFGVASGSTAPASATASISWTKGGTAYSGTTFTGYSTAYTATYTVAIPDGYAYQAGSTAVTLGGTAAGTVTVNGASITFTKTYTTAAETGTVLPPTPADPGSGMIKEDPSVTTGQTSYDFTYKSTVTGNPVMGKVTLKRKDGTTFNLNAQASGSVLYQMAAVPQSGYKFTSWRKTASNVSLFALDENGIDTSAATIEGTAEVLKQYTAVFAEQSAVVAGDPKLDQMTVSTADGRSILLRTDHNKDGFASDVTDYLLYLMPGVTGFDLNMKIEIHDYEMAAFDTVVKVDSAAVTPTHTTTDGIVTYTYAKNVSTTNGDVKIEVTSGSKTTTYTVKVAAAATAPTIAMDVEDKGTGVYGLDVSLENSIANEFAFKLKLDSSVFAGFSKSGSELTAADVKANLTSQLATGSAFEVVSAAYDPASNTLTAVLATSDNSYVDCTTKTLVGSLEFKTVAGGSVSTADWAKLTIDSDFGASTLSDQRFAAFTETDAAFDAGLIRITVPDMMTIAGYLTSLMKADVQAGLATISIKNGEDVVGAATLDGNRRFTGKVSGGTYTLEITLPNYVKITTTVDETNAIIGALAMTAGDLTGDGVVDTLDRTQLISLLYSTVSAGAIGDIDGDGKVTGGDLGYLLANM